MSSQTSPKNRFLCVLNCITGGCAAETPWAFAQITGFMYSVGPQRKPRFQYRLPIVGDVCRPCWILCAGYRNRNNTRIRSIEVDLWEGKYNKGVRLPQKRPLNASSYVTAFISEYIFKQSQSSPSDRILYVDFLGLQDLHARQSINQSINQSCTVNLRTQYTGKIKWLTIYLLPKYLSL